MGQTGGFAASSWLVRQVARYGHSKGTRLPGETVGPKRFP